MIITLTEIVIVFIMKESWFSVLPSLGCIKLFITCCFINFLPNFLFFLQCGKIYVGADNNSVQIFTYPAAELDGMLTRFTAPVTHISVTPDGKFVAASSRYYGLFQFKITNNKYVSPQISQISKWNLTIWSRLHPTFKTYLDCILLFSCLDV